MAITIRDTNSTTFATNTTFGDTGEDFYLLPGVLLASTGSDALMLNAADVSLTLDGTVIAQSAAIDSSGGFGGNFRLHVGSTGTLSSMESDSGSFAVALRGGSSDVINYGKIIGSEAIALFMRTGNNEVQNFGSIIGATGIQLFSDGTDDRIYNAGLISGSGSFDGPREAFEGTGIYVQSANADVFNALGGRIITTAPDAPAITAGSTSGGLVVQNYGEITAQLGTGVNLGLVAAAQSQISVLNWGTITGGLGAFVGSVNNDTLLNRGALVGGMQAGDGSDSVDNRLGTIQGNVLLGGDHDTYIGKGGVVFGTVFGESGNDTMSGNAAEEDIFDGGAGIDTLDFRALGAVTLALDNSIAAARSAFGDTYTGFERVIGSYGGNDLIIGDGQANMLAGLSGNDTLRGGGGADTLRGGQGVDVLTGAAGNDSFQFFGLNDFGDKILDFSSNSAGNNDRIMVSGSVGGGLANGTLAAGQFQMRADNLAQDANDRFILRTTDKTLWFDADGNASGAAVMLADLQQNATMTASDIFIF